MKPQCARYKLREICTLINGRAYSKPELLAEGKYPVLRVGNFFTNNGWYYSDLELEPEKYCNSGDLLYAWSASFGPHIWTGGKTIFHYHIWKVQPNPALINKGFLYFWFLWDIDRIKEDHGTGTTMIHVGKGSMEEREIAVPSLSEQQRIVRILDKAFENIAIAKVNAEKNLQNARAILESYLQSIFTQLGEGWVQAKLSDICAKITDGTHQTPTYYDNGIVFLSSRNVTTGRINWNDVKYIDKKQHTEMQKRVSPRLDDILLAKNGTTGIAAIVDKDITFDIYVSLALLRSGTEIIPALLLHFINSPVAKQQFNKRLKGIGVPNLHLEEIREVVISFPKSLQEQKNIATQIDTLREQIQFLSASYQRKLAALEALKKSLLHQAFTGNL